MIIEVEFVDGTFGFYALYLDFGKGDREDCNKVLSKWLNENKFVQLTKATESTIEGVDWEISWDGPHINISSIKRVHIYDFRYWARKDDEDYGYETNR